MMTLRTRFRVLGLAVTAACAASASAQAPPRGSGSVTVAGPIRVIEADTFEIGPNGTQIGVGVIGIKAPQGNTECGRQAIAIAQELVATGQIWFDEEDALPSFDRRYRRMYRVTTANGLSLAVQLAFAGVVEAEPADDASQDFPAIAAAQADARGAGRGCRWANAGSGR